MPFSLPSSNTYVLNCIASYLMQQTLLWQILYNNTKCYSYKNTLLQYLAEYGQNAH